MKNFTDETGRAWVASAREEQTPRHHGRWQLVIHPAADDQDLLEMPEVRWQTMASAQRTLETMSPFELRRRLHVLLERRGAEAGATPDGAVAGSGRVRTSASAG